MILDATNLTRRFGTLTAVDDLDISLEESEILGLVGPNGAGKTTTFNLLTGLLPATSGTIKFKGENITENSAAERAQRGLVRIFQENRTFGALTVAKNVELGGYSQTHWLERPDETIVEDILTRVGLEEVATTESQNLSHGEIRRLQVAIGLAAEPDLLLLDEPTAGLNEQETQDLMDLVTSLTDDGVGIIVVEHDIDTITTYSDRMIVLNNGKKLAEGPPAKVQNDEDVIEAYLGGVDFA